MNNKILLGLSTLAILAAMPAFAETTVSVTEQQTKTNADGSVSYEKHTIINKDKTGAVTDVKTKSSVETAVVTAHDPSEPFVTFYYYNPNNKMIMSGYDLTPDIAFMWDKDRNKVIDNHEYYTDALVMYEPMEYSKRTYQDIDADGFPELTQKEYTIRLQKLPAYGSINKNGKDGLTLYEFTGAGFQEADINNDNQVSIDELREVFYHQKGLVPLPEKINK